MKSKSVEEIKSFKINSNNKTGQDQIFTGRLFQLEGALNINTFLAIDLETAGTGEKKQFRVSQLIIRRKLPKTVLNSEGY